MVNKSKKGFTIIEVLIVLAIGGLIMLIVFLAVPALNRNSRNQGIKADASNILSGFTDFTQANNGVNPTGFVAPCNVGMTECTFTAAGASNVSFTKSSQTTVTMSAIDVVGWTTKTQTGQVHIITNAGCNGNTPILGQKRSTAARYLVETGNANTAVALQCAQG